MAYDALRGEVVLFGGNRVLFGDSASPPAMLGDTWLLRDDGWIRVSGSGPMPRAEAAAAHDVRRRRTVLFGGRVTSPLGTHPVGHAGPARAQRSLSLRIAVFGSRGRVLPGPRVVI
jgi:hypothetical protein